MHRPLAPFALLVSLVLAATLTLSTSAPAVAKPASDSATVKDKAGDAPRGSTC